MGKTDRIARIILAAIMGALYATGTVSGTIGFVLLIAAIVFIFTSAISFCPLYKIFGLHTCPLKQKK